MTNQDQPVADVITARKQAEVDARQTLGANPPLAAIVIARACSDAASDVWDPLLREALSLIKGGLFPGKGKLRDDFVQRAEEALR